MKVKIKSFVFLLQIVLVISFMTSGEGYRAGNLRRSRVLQWKERNLGEMDTTDKEIKDVEEEMINEKVPAEETGVLEDNSEHERSELDGEVDGIVEGEVGEGDADEEEENKIAVKKETIEAMKEENVESKETNAEQEQKDASESPVEVQNDKVEIENKDEIQQQAESEGNNFEKNQDTEQIFTHTTTSVKKEIKVNSDDDAQENDENDVDEDAENEEDAKLDTTDSDEEISETQKEVAEEEEEEADSENNDETAEEEDGNSEEDESEALEPKDDKSEDDDVDDSEDQAAGDKVDEEEGDITDEELDNYDEENNNYDQDDLRPNEEVSLQVPIPNAKTPPSVLHSQEKPAKSPKPFQAEDDDGDYFRFEILSLTENSFFYLIILIGCCVSGYAAYQFKTNGVAFFNSGFNVNEYARVPTANQEFEYTNNQLNKKGGRVPITPDVLRIN